MIAIRVDANNIISTGHLIRCITVADAIKAEGEDVLFITADDYAGDILKKSGYTYISLGTDYSKPHSEIEALLTVLKEHGIERMLLDSNRIDQQYINSVGKHVKLSYFDDSNRMYKGLACVIQYSPFADWGEYLQSYCGTSTGIFIGSAYAPLRPEFSEVERSVKKSVDGIMIATGGTDPMSVSYKLTELLAQSEELAGVKINVVVGYMYDNVEAYNRLASQYDNIVLYQNDFLMSDVMCDSDIAVSAGGTTLLELCACGTPTVAFAFTDDQNESVRQMINYKYMVGVGDIRISLDYKLKAIKDYIIELSKDYDKRFGMSNHMRTLVDGKGAIRIAKGIIES